MRSPHEADRRFEFGVHDGVPESPRPIYQVLTHANAGPYQASGGRDVRSRGRSVARYVLQEDGRVVVTTPSDDD